MAFHLEVDPQAVDQIRALPEHALPMLAEAMTVLELAPWNGRPYVETKPDGALRQLLFGDGVGIITYLVLDEQRRVDVLDVLWLP
ncbi:mRNA-degrading endonuclease RelE, toxin component of the RelBE toxin-antitoxin system [Amycolatopsis xylanica]|uniref:mRNA-degrading endonuclease RelE, toxin component of the RelBE toxin-antitoxin system n=1 Tax=Amycolatopsis xylanica TaxID=589385 RepID=A0A1H3LP31_9PSEU|nr:hypothetical protein [Amycolatopsis xylanica]SDY66182.1 mRNA-degrading endonuclease RelE, toxin component of the RelBE toxin-antitoxin system [Amycolatopsis xylanica]